MDGTPVEPNTDLLANPDTFIPGGSITFHTGPMGAEKSAQNILAVKRFEACHLRVIYLRPMIDTRRLRKGNEFLSPDLNVAESRTGLTHPAIRFDPKDLDGFMKLVEGMEVVAIEEFHFCPPEIVPLLVTLMRRGVIILIAGLDCDFRGCPLPTTLALMSVPETQICKLQAVCCKCRKLNATRTQRLRHGKPVSIRDPIYVVDDGTQDITYESRCLGDHELLP